MSGFQTEGDNEMTNAHIPHTLLLAPVAGFANVFGLVRSWQKQRRDRRIIDGLSDDQLKDIGYRRMPSGELDRSTW
jgi:uncharacterized protein YjiS (DUF1127 family)